METTDQNRADESAVLEAAVIGLGPAGVSACMKLAEEGIPVTAFEFGAIGGQVNMTASIDNYPGYSGPAFDLTDRFSADIDRLVKAGSLKVVHSQVKSLERTPEGLFSITTPRASFLFKAVIIASGTRYRPYAVPDPDHTVRGRGFSRCAICDGPLYKGKDVMVVGGGEAAFQEALYLSTICHSVTLINRRTIFRASIRDVEAFKSAPNTRIIAPAVTVSCSGDGHLQHVVIKDPNDPTDASLQTLDVEACFIYIGSDAATAFVKIPEALDEKGNVKVNEGMAVAEVPGLFGAGDVIDTPLRQVATAVGYGSLAALALTRYLERRR